MAVRELTCKTFVSLEGYVSGKMIPSFITKRNECRVCFTIVHCMKVTSHKIHSCFMTCPIVRELKVVKWSRYRPSVAQRVGRGIALLFHYRGTRRGWVVSNTPWPHSTPGKDPVPIVQEAGWAPGPVWTGGKSHHHRDSIPDRPAHSQSLYRLSYPAYVCELKLSDIYIYVCVCVHVRFLLM